MVDIKPFLFINEWHLNIMGLLSNKIFPERFLKNKLGNSYHFKMHVQLK